AAIFNDERCLAESRHEGAPNYSISLFQMTNELLEGSGVSLSEIDLFAAASGPGAFTGIRVGLAAAQAWSHAFEKPWRGVSVFEAMAEESLADTEWALTLLDARRGELYAGLLQRPATLPGCATQEEVLGGGWVLKPDRLVSMLASHVLEGERVTCIARGEDTAAAAFQPLMPPSWIWRSVNAFLVPAIARAARRALQQGRPARGTDLSAYYVRRTSAELNLKE
ncbi:MAG: tRNA (adenosine(37)-N6)-threonylcarbamoyltransferase complex dimerization subunit type 1 TsaB, partial [Terriglobia bacterium]